MYVQYILIREFVGHKVTKNLLGEKWRYIWSLDGSRNLGWGARTIDNQARSAKPKSIYTTVMLQSEINMVIRNLLVSGKLSYLWV